MNCRYIKQGFFVLIALSPLAMGANCSTNAVAQAAVTTFFNSLASGVAANLVGG